MRLLCDFSRDRSRSALICRSIVHDTTHFNELLVSNKANGYRDLLAVIDLSTYRRLAWEKNMPLFLCSFIVPETGEWLAVDPRSALKMVLHKVEKKGWKCKSFADFEVRLLDPLLSAILLRGLPILVLVAHHLQIVLSVQGDCGFTRGKEVCRSAGLDSR